MTRLEGGRRPTRALLLDTELQVAVALDLWTIEGHNFELTFVAAGFHQHFRSRPVDAGKRQTLGDRRGRHLRSTSFPA